MDRNRTSSRSDERYEIFTGSVFVGSEMSLSGAYCLATAAYRAQPDAVVTAKLGGVVHIKISTVDGQRKAIVR